MAREESIRGAAADGLVELDEVGYKKADFGAVATPPQRALIALIAADEKLLMRSRL